MSNKCQWCRGEITSYGYHGLCPYCGENLRKPNSTPPDPPKQIKAQPSENGIAYNYILHLLKQQRNLLSRFSLNSEEEILEELETIRIAEKWISDK